MRTMALMAICAGLALGQKAAVSGDQAYQEFQDDRRREVEVQLQALKAQIVDVEAQIAQMQERYSDRYPDLQVLRIKLKVLQNQIDLSKATLTRLPPPKPALPQEWWKAPKVAALLELTPEQQKKISDLLEWYRIQLLDENSKLKRQETTLDQLISMASLPEEATINAQIDRAASARAELEKTNGRMLLSILRVLTPEQWKTLVRAYNISVTPK